MFNSQNPNNSLNDMLTLKKHQDVFISDELEPMFEDGNIKLQNIIDFENKKAKEKRKKY